MAIDTLKIGIIGLGKMGEALVQGLKDQPPARKVTVKGTTRTSGSNAELVEQSDVIILSVKPHQAHAVVKEIASKLKKSHLLISVCASVTTEELEEWTGRRCAIVRAMPNTPALVGEGMTVLCAGSTVSRDQLDRARHIFDSVGQTEILEESLFDGVTGLSGCGPAYAYLMIEALSEAGVKVGIPRKTATLLAAQTLLGASKMVLSRHESHPAALKDEVTTPAGCTIDGLMALEEGKLRVTLIKAVLAATSRSRKLKK